MFSNSRKTEFYSVQIQKKDLCKSEFALNAKSIRYIENQTSIPYRTI